MVIVVVKGFYTIIHRLIFPGLIGQNAELILFYKYLCEYSY